MITAIKVAYILGLRPRARRQLIREYLSAYLLNRPELLQAVRESLPASIVPPFDELIAASRRADWTLEP